MVLIIGFPFFLLFLGLVRALALAEGRMVEGADRHAHAAPPRAALDHVRRGTSASSKC